MEILTTFTKGEHKVTVESCCKVIDGGLKCFHLKDTDKYYARQFAACQAAQQMLLKKVLSENDLKARKLRESKLRNAQKVVHIHNCVTETELYILKWNGVLYLETKKNLRDELKGKLQDACVKYGFDNAYEAINLIKKENIIKNKLK